MRIFKLTLAEINFQYKYGFYLLYAVFTFFYIILLSVFPIETRKTAAAIMIYSDPAAIGLFFMGAIVLLEKSQMVLNSIAVSPVKAVEYIGAKVLSLTIISTIVGVSISLFAMGTNNLIYVIISLVLASILFSLVGMIIAVKISSLNQFVIVTIPFQILFTIPPVLLLFGVEKFNLIIHPGVCAIRLIYGNENNPLLLIIVILVWIVLVWIICVKSVKKAFLELGGVKL